MGRVWTRERKYLLFYPAQKQQSMKRINVLLIEDNEGDILLTKEAFEESGAGICIISVRDGEKAIDFFETLRNDEDVPHLVLLDINIPKISGHGVLVYIKNSERFKNIPVIILTTSSSQNDILQCYNNHANCYIIKPIDLADFINTINKIGDFWTNVATIPFNKIHDRKFS